jgi:lysyl-tRNA synthetase, class II
MIAQSSSSPERAVKMSNHASITSNVAAAVAVKGATGKRFHSAMPVAAMSAVSTTSNPTQAMSQCEETWRDGSRTASQAVQGMSRTAATASTSATRRVEPGPVSQAGVRLTGLRAAVTSEKVLAVATALAAGVSIASALTPDLASRSELIRGALPEGAAHFAGAVTIAFGIALLWVSLALARRKRRAWQLAVVLMAGTAVSHLVKGLDVEEATASLAVLAGLLACRRRFTVGGCPDSLRPLVYAVLGLGGVTAVICLAAVGAVTLPARVQDAFALLAGGLAFGALYLWFRPLAAQLHESASARGEAERIVGETGCDTLSFFALRGDKSYFFSPSGRSFLAYRVLHGVALVSGDPIGDDTECGELVAEFRRVAQARGWRTAVLASREGLLPVYRSMGLKPLYLGDEAVVVPSEFSLEGRPIRKVRQSVTRLEREGYRMRVLEVGDVDEPLADELRAVSAEWRGRWPERGFTMAMDGLFAYPDTLVAVAEREDGHVGGFVHLVPVPATGGISLASMRRRADEPNGLMEFLLARTIEWAREREVPEFSLNFSVFAQLILNPSTASHSALRFALLRLDRVFQIDRLLRFNRKFFPEWRPRYVCLESMLDFPLVGLAYLRAESLLTPPGPWVRGPDVAEHA